METLTLFEILSTIITKVKTLESSGVKGNGISSTVLNDDYTLTLVFDDGSSYTTPSIRGETGEVGPQGEQGIQGEKGADGKTPVKGTDYWTEEDIAEIKTYVDEAILGGAW